MEASESQYKNSNVKLPSPKSELLLHHVKLVKAVVAAFDSTTTHFHEENLYKDYLQNLKVIYSFISFYIIVCFA